MKYQIIYITASTKEEAKKISRALVEERLAACVNIFPVDSVYWWEGKVEEGKEVGMMVKTQEKRVEEVIKRVKELHSYKVPCIVGWDIKGGNKEFLEWVGKETE